MDKLKIKFVSFNTPGLSYTLASIAYLKALLTKNIQVSWHPVPCRSSYLEDQEKNLAKFVYRPLDYDLVILHIFPEAIAPYLDAEFAKNKFVVIYTTWETTLPPDLYIQTLNKVDLVLVPCHWNKEVFKNSGVNSPIEVVPHIFEPPPLPIEKRVQKKFPYVFYNLGVLCYRKAQIDTLEAYLERFTPDDPVVFRIKTSRNLFMTDKNSIGLLRQVWQKYKNPAKVEVFDYHLTDQEVIQFHLDSHCFVSLTRGEGWGLAGFEAGGLGNPVLMPRMGGQQDYLPIDYNYTIEHKLVPVDQQEAGTFYRGSWAEPSKKSAGALMQSLFQDYLQASTWEETQTYQQGLKLQQYIQQNFSAEKAADILLAALEKHYKPKL